MVPLFLLQIKKCLFQDLGKLYKKKEDKNNFCTKNKDEELFPALKSASFEVKSGQVFGLLGPNGAGKTTTLSIMTAEETPSWGKVSCRLTELNQGALLSGGYCTFKHLFTPF